MAGHVTEREILSLLKQTFKHAAEHCDKLAILPGRGPTYRKLREDQTLTNVVASAECKERETHISSARVQGL